MGLTVSEGYDALIEAGTSEEKAKAAAGAIPVVKDLATKEDLAELASELRAEIADGNLQLRPGYSGAAGQGGLLSLGWPPALERGSERRKPMKTRLLEARPRHSRRRPRTITPVCTPLSVPGGGAVRILRVNWSGLRPDTL